MARLALFTFGVFREPADSPVNQTFRDRNDPILAAAELSAGFIARAGYDDEPGSELWGEQVYPRFYVERGDGWTPATLSLWRDLESAMAFSYAGLHAVALSLGRAWFAKGDWPPYALWWVPEDHRPEWAEAAARHEFLHDEIQAGRGPSAKAFTFKQPFDADGNPVRIDRERVKQLAEQNAKAVAGN